MAAAPSNDAIRIIPVSLIRQYELPTLRDNDDTIPDDEWVTRVLRLENTAAPRVVPLLRPMIPKEGHLIGEAEANLLIVVAPYGVTKRVVGIAGEIDANADKPQASSQ